MVVRAASILIVDDDQVYLDLLKLQLESYGFRVITAGSALEGWSKLEREPIELVVLDIDMPGEDGHAFARKLRANTRLSPLPVVFLTGLPAPGERAKAFSSGADDFLAKPCNVAELVTCVKAHLKRSAWQRRIDEGLARIQDVERTRDELLALMVHEVGGLVEVVQAELRQAMEPGRVTGPGSEDIQRALVYANGITQLVNEVRLRYGWRRITPPPTPIESKPVGAESDATKLAPT
jgi:DNA-binding response OmpR family regulator